MIYVLVEDRDFVIPYFILVTLVTSSSLSYLYMLHTWIPQPSYVAALLLGLQSSNIAVSVLEQTSYVAALVLGLQHLHIFASFAFLFSLPVHVKSDVQLFSLSTPFWGYSGSNRSVPVRLELRQLVVAGKLLRG